MQTEGLPMQELERLGDSNIPAGRRLGAMSQELEPELGRLRDSDIPAGRRLLREQHGNLLRVADYCHGHYLQAGDKRKALEETMALSTQSLASVTYQITSVASAVLRLLELQAAQLRQLEADVTCVAQTVALHQEKVSRREIGALTVPRRVPSCPRVVAPPGPPELEPYCRRPLSFSALDHLGHGVKDTSTQLSRTGTLARKSTKGCSAQAAGTLGRSGRVPEPVQPPVVPEGKLSAASSSSLSSSSSSSSSSSLASLSSSGAPAEGIPAPPPLPGPPLLPSSPPGPPLLPPSPPGPPLLPPSPPGPPVLPLSPPGPPPAPAGAIPAPPPLPGDLLPPPPGDLLPPPVPGDLLPPPPGDLLPPPVPGDLLPPPPGDLAVPPAELLPPEPPPLTHLGSAAPDDLELPPPPSAVPDSGDSALPPPPATEDPPWAPESYLERAVALFPYVRQKDTELSLEPGALLFVTRRRSDGWCEGVGGQGAGVFPGSYVQPL